MRAWWRLQIRGVDQRAVIEKVRGEGNWSPRFGFMTCMSAGIAILGLILSSPAVVIGAMLLSPLMGPILAIGFALATGDANWLRDASKALVLGTLIAVFFCALIVFVSPLQTVTSEIAARTRPNLFDLLVALFSALAGGYAMIRGREGTIVGVAIATALMPPLAVVGFGLATWNWTVFAGALALFVTNLVTIAVSAALMARLYGFRSNLSAKQTLYQTIGIVFAILLLAIPLGFSLKQIAWEARASTMISGAIRDQFERSARISQIDIDFGAHPLAVTAAVLTPQTSPQAETLAKRILERELERPLNLTIRQFVVGTGDSTETAELAAARNEERQRMQQERSTLASQLALVAGVDEGAVFIDPVQRRATVKAAIFPDAGLGTYRALESRVAAAAPGWTILLQPPPAALPDIVPPEANIPASADEAAREKAVREAIVATPAFALAAWAAERVGAPIGVSGPAPSAELLVAALQARNIAVRLTDDKVIQGPVRLSWLAPDAGSQQPTPKP